MIGPEIPENEQIRLMALKKYKVLDTPAERAFDDITWLASKITGAPIALVSLIDSNRQWFKSKQGLSACETSREISFCGHAINQMVPFQVTNAAEDQRFHDNPLVTGPPHIRFYMGIPLTTSEGLNMGTLCVIDHKARKLNDETTAMLLALANQVVSQLELRLAISELRRHALIADEANQAKSRFLANMSHEIRTPMNAVIGLTDILMDSLDNVQQQEYLGIIKTSAGSLLRILNDILDLSKIEAGKLDLEIVPFDLKKTLRQVALVNQAHAVEKGISLTTEIDSDLPDSVSGDPVRLEQVLLNLVSNALKFTREGRVHLAAKIEEPFENGYRVHFSVSDSGIGIPLDKQERIFEAFTQADGSTTRLFGGTGLGLTISNQLVTMMGGHLGVESLKEGGTRFHFTIPIQSNRQKTLPEESVEEQIFPPTPPSRIMVVEDNRVNQMVIKRLLEKEGHKVIITENCREAMAAVRNQRFDLILMDIQLPEVDGFQTTAMIRQHQKEEGYQVPVIALTAHAMKGDSEQCLQTGMDAYLSKPIDRKLLKQTLGHFLRRNPNHQNP